MKGYNNFGENVKWLNSMCKSVYHWQGFTGTMQNGTNYRKSIGGLQRFLNIVVIAYF